MCISGSVTTSSETSCCSAQEELLITSNNDTWTWNSEWVGIRGIRVGEKRSQSAVKLITLRTWTGTGVAALKLGIVEGISLMSGWATTHPVENLLENLWNGSICRCTDSFIFPSCWLAWCHRLIRRVMSISTGGTPAPATLFICCGSGYKVKHSELCTRPARGRGEKWHRVHTLRGKFLLWTRPPPDDYLPVGKLIFKVSEGVAKCLNCILPGECGSFENAKLLCN